MVGNDDALGRAGAATLGARTATGKYINFLDDDDLLYADPVKKLVSFLEMTGERAAHSDCERTQFEWGNGGPRPAGEAQPFHGLDYDRTRLLIGNYLPMMTVMFERSLVEEVGGFDASLEVLEDWNFWIRVSKQTDFHRVPGVTALYRVFVEHPYGLRAEPMHQRLRDEWDGLAASTAKRVQALQAENDKLDAAIDEARRELGVLRSTLAWTLAASLPQGAMKALGLGVVMAPDIPPQPMATEPFTEWRRRGVSDWTWKHVEHPWGAKKIIVATASDGRLLAHYAGYPTRFLDSAGAEPRILTGLQIGDAMTAPAVRGLGGGRAGLLRQITESYFEQFCERQVDFNFGFNTGKIQRYYLRLIAGSQFFEDVPFQVLDCTATSLAKLGEIGSGLAGCNIRRVRAVDAEWDRFFDQCAGDYGVLTQRNREYVRWRYLDRPEADYQFYAAYSSGALVGWSVFLRDGQRLIWGDGLFARKSAAAFAGIVGYAMEEGINSGARSVEGWFSSRPPWWSQTASEAGFEPRPLPNRIAMIYKPFAGADPGELFAAHLYYTGGDSDLF